MTEMQVIARELRELADAMLGYANDAENQYWGECEDAYRQLHHIANRLSSL